MKGDKVPDTDHVAHYCRGSNTNEDGSINGAAFMLREIDKYLSVNWLEYLRLENRHKEIIEVRKILEQKISIGTTAKIAVLNVGEIRRYVAEKSPDRRDLHILHEPEENDPSHSGVYDYSMKDDLIADLIAETVRESYLIAAVKNFPKPAVGNLPERAVG